MSGGRKAEIGKSPPDLGLETSKAMKTTYIGIGSNLGDRVDNCRRAIDLMGRVPGSRLTACAHYYLSEPVGVCEQDWFINTVVSLATELSPRNLLQHLLEIELSLGRVRLKRWDARTIDLDLLLFGHEIINNHNLTVPHPLMHQRRFVLKPMTDLAPELKHPVLGLTMAELLDNLKEDKQKIILVKDL